MKKFFALTLMFLCLSISTTFAYENPYPNYWNNDKNFPIVWANQGVYCYLDKTSIKIILDDYPFYIISVKVLVVSYTYTDEEGNSGFYEEPKIIYGDEQEFLYDYEERDMRIRNRENQWVYIRPNFALENKRARDVNIGEAIFYLSSWKCGTLVGYIGLRAQHAKFYGDYLIKDFSAEYNNKALYYQIYSDRFYKLLDGESEDGDDS